MPETTTFHPQPDEHGKPVRLARPSTPTAPDTWLDPHAVASVTPLGELPTTLNGIPFAPWLDIPTGAADWAAVDGQAAIDEPPFAPPPGKAPAAGVVIVETDGRIWAVSPSNGFGGYATTFPKGRVDPGVGLQATAIREAFEESGLRVAIVAHLLDCARTQTHTHLYLARRIGGNPSLMGWESQAVHLVPPGRLTALLQNAHDRAVIAAIRRVLGD